MGFEKVWVPTRLQIARALARQSRRILPSMRRASDRSGEMQQKSLADLNACSQDDFVAALANVFEYSPWIAEQAASLRPFAGVKQLFAAMKVRGRSRGAGASAGADQGASRSRQQDPARRGADRRNPAPSRTASASIGCRTSNMRRSSASTTPTVPNSAIPYIVCVRRHTRDSILRDFERRLPNDAAAETPTSIAEINRIAALRLDQLVAAEDRLSVQWPAVDPCARYP